MGERKGFRRPGAFVELRAGPGEGRAWNGEPLRVWAGTMISTSRDSFLFRMVFLLVGTWALVAEAADPNWDARVLERILAEAAPGARDIRVGDMLLPRAYVEAARNRAAGKSPDPQLDSAFAGTLTLWPGGVVPYDFAAD